jgi:hypothetical protein
MPTTAVASKSFRWIRIATSRRDKNAGELIQWYGKRFTIAATFRDTTHGLLGKGLSAAHIRDKTRRGRPMIIAAIAPVLLTLPGIAAERRALDRTLRPHTSKKRQLYLCNQGLRWYVAIPSMREHRLPWLIDAYAQVPGDHALTCELFGVL